MLSAHWLTRGGGVILAGISSGAVTVCGCNDSRMSQAALSHQLTWEAGTGGICHPAPLPQPRREGTGKPSPS